jgi:hypothetical protein
MANPTAEEIVTQTQVVISTRGNRATAVVKSTEADAVAATAKTEAETAIEAENVAISELKTMVNNYTKEG